MTTVKKTITVPAELVDQAEGYARGNFSAYVTRAVSRQVAADRLAQFVADDAAQRGAIPQDEIDAMNAEIDALARR